MPDETSRSGVSGPAGLSPDSFAAPEPPAGGPVSASERIDAGGPAFPAPSVNGLAPVPPEPGMSLRDWLAGQAVSGAMVDRPHEAFFNPSRCAEFARAAYGLADAMLAARKGGAK